MILTAASVYMKYYSKQSRSNYVFEQNKKNSEIITYLTLAGFNTVKEFNA